MMDRRSSNEAPSATMGWTVTAQQLLMEHPFTKSLSMPEIDKIAAVACEEAFACDQIILLAGERSRNFYLVLSGSVRVEACAPHHRVSIQTLGAGEAFGWSSLLGHHDTLFQIRAQQQTRVMRLDGARLSQACDEDPKFGLALFRRILELVAGRVKATESRLGEFCGIAMSSPSPPQGKP